MAQIRRQLCQGFEHEAAIRHARMRNLQLRRVDDGFFIEENVDVDSAGAFRYDSFPAQIALDLSNACEQIARRKSSPDFYNLIEEPGLLAHLLRLGLVDGGSPQDLYAFIFETFQSLAKIRLAVAEVRSEREIGSGQKS